MVTRVLILGVNPFEDLPGYQLLGLLKSTGRYDIIAADDSIPALKILSMTGTRIHQLPHPSSDPHRFTNLVARLCQEQKVRIILPGTDAHLYALAACLVDEPQLALLCPTLAWLAAKELRNKWDLQAWASRFAITPSRWTFDNEGDAVAFTARAMYPLMVKGRRKGAMKCDDELEAVVARRAILRNPANDGEGGGVYAEAFVEGEEHSLLLLTDGRGRFIRTIGFHKLASTQLGTTLAAQVDGDLPSEVNLDALSSEVSVPGVLELEWRKDATGNQWLFEINARFPSWIGALGKFGLTLLEGHMNCVLGRSAQGASFTGAPDVGSIFYRLPQSGFLPMEAVFGPPTSPRAAGLFASCRPVPLLWKAASPHQFRMK
jgi:hypothetical protein